MAELAEVGDRPEISVLIPCYNEEGNVREIVAAVTRELDVHARSHEIIVIDNASTDRTWDHLRAICAADPRVRGIRNIKNFGQLRSPVHGFYQTRGEAVLTLCADFQDPPELIGELIRHWRNGAEIVMGQWHNEKTAPHIHLIRWLGYGFLGRFADNVLPRGVAGYGLFSRRVVDTLSKWNEPEPFFRGMLAESGFPMTLVPFDRQPRAAGESKNTLKELTSFALSGITASSKRLLRLPVILSFYAFIASILLTGATVYAALTGGAITLLMLLATQAGIFSVMLLFLGLMGDQIRIISERQRNTPLVIEQDRLNFGPTPDNTP